MALTIKQEAKAWGRIAQYLRPTATNMRTLLFNAMQYIVNLVKWRFVRSQDAYGVPFPDIKQKTKDAKRRKGYPLTIGVASGKMRDEIDTQPTYDATGAEYGRGLDDLEYPGYFSEGTGKMPPRPILEVTDEDDEKVVALLENEVYRILETTK